MHDFVKYVNRWPVSIERELYNFTNVVLPGKSHLTAIVAGSIPKEYVESLTGFINSHDQ